MSSKDDNLIFVNISVFPSVRVYRISMQLQVSSNKNCRLIKYEFLIVFFKSSFHVCFPFFSLRNRSQKYLYRAFVVLLLSNHIESRWKQANKQIAVKAVLGTDSFLFLRLLTLLFWKQPGKNTAILSARCRGREKKERDHWKLKDLEKVIDIAYLIEHFKLEPKKFLRYTNFILFGNVDRRNFGLWNCELSGWEGRREGWQGEILITF